MLNTTGFLLSPLPIQLVNIKVQYPGGRLCSLSEYRLRSLILRVSAADSLTCASPRVLVDRQRTVEAEARAIPDDCFVAMPNSFLYETSLVPQELTGSYEVS